ncbi:hypothetical protein ACFL5N_00835, partial [bacterium]
IVDLDKYIDIKKPVDITIISYDQEGNMVEFKGKKILKISRNPFIEKIIVHTKDGRIKKGEDVNITIKGYNFQKGKFGVLLMWTGLPIIYTDCNNSRQVRFTLLGEDSALIPKPGEYGVYIYNKDGSGRQADEKIIVVE